MAPFSTRREGIDDHQCKLSFGLILMAFEDAVKEGACFPSSSYKD